LHVYFEADDWLVGCGSGDGCAGGGRHIGRLYGSGYSPTGSGWTAIWIKKKCGSIR
jgi:hypothetical protein